MSQNDVLQGDRFVVFWCVRPHGSQGGSKDPPGHLPRSVFVDKCGKSVPQTSHFADVKIGVVLALWVVFLLVCWVVGCWIARALVCWVVGEFDCWVVWLWVIHLMGCLVVWLFGCCVILNNSNASPRLGGKT